KQEQGNAMNEVNDNNNKNVEKETEKTELEKLIQGLICKDIAQMKPTSFNCPDCKKATITSIVKAMFYNSEHSICASGDSIPIKDNNYQSSYAIKSGLSYELKANKIRQHAKSIEDLRDRSEQAMNSAEIKNLVTELQKFEIT
ncbi:hypothetical protein RFI_28641, partial [Reticulomyxa filosa]